MKPFSRDRLKLYQEGCKSQFKLLFIGSRHHRRIVVPTRWEMIGLEVMAQEDTLSNFVLRDRKK